MRKTTHTSKPTVQLLYVMDESGSMESIKASVIDGFNEYMNGLKKKGNFKVTLVKFDSNGIRTPYTALDVKKVPKLNDDTYSPGATTPLYDSVVESVENFAKEITNEQAALVCAMTDGLENASTKHNEQCLRELIEKLTKRGNWTFTFMGANQDSWATAQRWGISSGNIANWQATSAGTKHAFNLMAMSSTSFADTVAENKVRGTAMNVNNFFSQPKGSETK